jgi:two-component system chemotaxis response regulator CheY
MIVTALRGLESATFSEAGSGLEALERMTLTPIDLMILDLNMPEMHGIEVLQFVRAHNTYCRLPVIVLTTRGDETSRSEATASGATDYMTKPFQAHELLELVRNLLPENEKS